MAPDPTQPAPLSEDELQAIEKRHQSRELLSKDLYDLQRYRDESDLLAEVRRLNAENTGLQGDVSIVESCWRKSEDELFAVRAAVEEESKRADRAEAAARELRQLIRDMGITYVGHTRRAQLMASTAWLTGGNEQPITEEGKGNGK